METALIIISIGIFIFLGHFFQRIFDRHGVPDVLGLMLIGILIGPVLHLVNPDSFGQLGSIFSNLVLVFILFESGTDLKMEEVKASFRASAGITITGFLTTWASVAALCYFIFELPVLSCLFIGATLGGTSSAVVTGLVRKSKVQAKTATTLIMESAETDVFTLGIPLGILGLMVTGEMNAGTVISGFVAALVLAILIGVGGGFLWSYILGKFPAFKRTHFSTPAFVLVLYGVAEYLKFSGPLTALSFGITIGNLAYLEPKILERFVPNKRIVLPRSERQFFGEIVFLLRIFFFVFIGISIRINRIDWLLWGALITAVLFVIRIFAVKLVVHRDTPILDKAVLSVMIPKGLGAAVIATLPLQQGHADGGIIQSLCFAVILFSTVYCAGLFFLVNRGFTMPFYRMVYGREREAVVEVGVEVEGGKGLVAGDGGAPTLS